jgi:uncharacterized protein
MTNIKHKSRTSGIELSTFSNSKRKLLQHESRQIFHFAKVRFYRDDLISAFAGDLQPVINAPLPRQIASPMPLGICVHGMNMLLNIQARKLTVMYVVAPLALFAGGVASLLASTASMYLADTFGYTVFGSNAGIWMAIAYNLLPSIRQGLLSPSEDGFDQAQALFFLGCFMTYLLFSLMTVKSTWPFLAVFFLTAITILLLSLCYMTGHVNFQRGVRLYWHYHHSLQLVLRSSSIDNHRYLFLQS